MVLGMNIDRKEKKMKLEVLLSVMNLKKEDLDKMNITSTCTVINQCEKEDFEEYKNFKIYSYKERGISNSRNRALEKAKAEILLLCDDDVIYNKDYEKNIIEEFKNNSKADIIIFNMENPYRNKRKIKKNKRLHIYNSLNFASYNIAFRRESINNIKFNTNFGPNAIYKSGGDDTLFIVDCLKNKLKIYSCNKNIGRICSGDSTWFKGYNEKYFFDKGALYTAINRQFRFLLISQHLFRHKEMLDEMKFNDALKAMLKGSNDYINKEKERQKNE